MEPFGKFCEVAFGLSVPSHLGVERSPLRGPLEAGFFLGGFPLFPPIFKGAG